MIIQELFPDPVSDPVHFAFQCNELKEMGNSELAVWARELTVSWAVVLPPLLVLRVDMCEYSDFDF